MKTHFRPRKNVAATSTGVAPTTLASMLPAAWVRPAHWPAMSEPTLNSIKLLYRMSANDVQPLTFRTGANAANISIDGDAVTYSTGTNDSILSIFPNYASNTTPVASDGYKYCVVTLTPVSTLFTSLYLDGQPSGYPNTSYLPTNAYVEVIVNMPTLTTLAMHGAAATGRLNPALEHVRFMAVNASMEYSRMFYKMTSLRKITCDLGYLDVRQNITEAFTDCALLTDFPKIIITSMGKINATNAYQGCKSMLGLPDINYDRIGVAANMFQACWNLLGAGNNVFAGATYVSGIFTNCYSLQWKDATVDIPYATTVSEVFTGCTNITKLPNINLPSATALGTILNSCNNLTEVGNIHAPVAVSASGLLSNTPSLLKVGNINLPLATSVDQLFYGNYRLRQVGTITTSTSLVSMNSMYYMCGELIDPVMPSNTQNVSSANSLFAYCRNMIKAPVLNLNATSCNSSNMFQECNKMVDASQVSITFAITASSMYVNCSAMTKPATAGYVYANTAPSFAIGCRSLQRFPPGVLSISRAFSVANSGLTTDGLNAMFTSLPTAYNFGSEAITITNCPGAATCDRTIATNKGWTLIG